MKVDKSTWTSIPFSDCVRTIKVNDAVQKKTIKPLVFIRLFHKKKTLFQDIATT